MSLLEILIFAAGVALLLGLLALTRPGVIVKKHRLDTALVSRRWEEIEMLASRDGSSLRLALIEADKLLDYALKHRGYRGQTMGERLRSAGGDFTNQNEIWSAHKIRNKLVHEAEYEVEPRLASAALRHFKQGLKDMRALR